MSSARAFLLRHRALAVCLILAALAMRALVPAGFMIGQGDRFVTVQICDDGQGHAQVAKLVIPSGEQPSEPGGKHGSGLCPYSSLTMTLLAGAAPALLALALAFILVLGFAPVGVPGPTRISHLRPPLRGPPSKARPT